LSPPAQTQPELAGDAASGWLAVFLSQSQSTASVKAQRIGASGNVLDAQPITISSGLRTRRNPAVAWNGSLWLVVWEEIGAPGPTGAGQVFGVRIDAS